MSKTNILHIIDTLGVGGAEKLLVATVNNLSNSNHHIIYLCGEDKLTASLVHDCKVTRLNFRSKLDIPRCVLSIRKYIKQHHVEVVHSHLVMSNILSRLACPRKVQLFNSIHSILGSRCFAPGKHWQRLVEKATYRKRHHIIGVSQEVLKDYHASIGIKGEHTLLPNFVDPSFFHAEPRLMTFNGTFRMVSVGNLKPAKNYAFLIDAFRHLPKGVHLDIYGDGPLREELQQQIDQYGVNVKLCGSSDNINKLIRNYDLFIMSSSVEGQAVALLEAMATGMPTAVSDIPVLRETTGNQGIYFDLSTTEDLVNKITAIANHQVDLDVYARANMKVVKQLASRQQYMQSLTTLYNINSKKAHPARPQAQPVYRQALNLQAS